VALSSTSPADFPLGHLPKDQPSTYSRPVKPRPSRAPCSAQNREYVADAVAGKDATKESSAFCGDPARPSLRGRPMSPGARAPSPRRFARVHPAARRAHRRRRSHAPVSRSPKRASTACASRLPPTADSAWGIVIKHDGRRGEGTITWRQRGPTPLRWAVLLGEFLYDLRSSLDHLARALVIANNRKPTKKTEFPLSTGGRQISKLKPVRRSRESARAQGQSLRACSLTVPGQTTLRARRFGLSTIFVTRTSTAS